jgi:Terpene cyclase DEP1
MERQVKEMTSSESAVPSLRSDATHKAGEAAPSSPRALAFLALAIAGLLGQLALFGVFLADNGLDPAEFTDQIFSSTIAALTFADLMMCAVVFLAWLPREAARMGIRRWWPFALASLGGLCFAFPLFLYVRERRRT